MSCKSQLTIYNIDTPPEQRTVTDNYYYKDIDNHHDAIVGTWRWQNGDSFFEITLQEFEQYSTSISPNIFIDKIFGKYTYQENGQVIANIESIDTFVDFKLSLSYRTPTEYAVVIRDVISDTGKIGEFILTSSTTATLSLRNSGGVKVNYGNEQEWSLPTSVTLAKIN